MRNSILLIITLSLIAIPGILGYQAFFEEDQESEVASTEKPNIIVINIESLRYDRLPCNGYSRNTTFYLCQFADKSTQYKNAYTGGEWTPLGITGTETGLYPFEIKMNWGSMGTIPESIHTSAEYLEEDGYEIYGNIPQKLIPGIEQGFNRTINESTREVGDGKFLQILESNEESVYIRYHYLPTHSPYTAPMRKQMIENNYTPEFVNNKSVVRKIDDSRTFNRSENPNLTRNLYDESIRVADRNFIRQVLSQIRNSGEYNQTMIIITSDHGEMLGEEEEWGHGNKMHYEEVLHVPLIVKYPGQKEGREKQEVVSTVDILPTILEEAGIDYNETKKSGVPLTDTRENRKVFAGASPYSIINYENKLSFCKKFGKHYCNRKTGNDSYLLFSYLKNRTETKMIEDTKLKEKLSQQLDDRLIRAAKLQRRNYRSEPNAEEKKEMRKRLKELGYIEE